MKKRKDPGLDFEVDRLTNSIENVVTGDSFTTDITLITISDLKLVTKKNKWQFDWKLEFTQPQRDVLQTNHCKQPICDTRIDKFKS